MVRGNRAYDVVYVMRMHMCNNICAFASSTLSICIFTDAQRDVVGDMCASSRRVQRRTTHKQYIKRIAPKTLKFSNLEWLFRYEITEKTATRTTTTTIKVLRGGRKTPRCIFMESVIGFKNLWVIFEDKTHSSTFCFLHTVPSTRSLLSLFLTFPLSPLSLSLFSIFLLVYFTIYSFSWQEKIVSLLNNTSYSFLQRLGFRWSKHTAKTTKMQFFGHLKLVDWIGLSKYMQKYATETTNDTEKCHQ